VKEKGHNILSTYWGWEKLNNLYKYFPDMSTQKLKEEVRSILKKSEPQQVTEKQIKDFIKLADSYSCMENEYCAFDSFDYKFMKNMSRAEIMIFSATLFSYLKHFFKIADLNESFVLYIYSNSVKTEDILRHVIKWTKIFCKNTNEIYEENQDYFRLTDMSDKKTIYKHDCPLVTVDTNIIKMNAPQKALYQKYIDSLCEFDAFPIVIGQKMHGEMPQNTMFTEFDKKHRSLNDVGKSIGCLYYDFINSITEKLNEECDEKKLLKLIKKNYRSACSMLSGGKTRDAKKINELAYLLASLFTFKDMMEEKQDIPINNIIEQAVTVFYDELSIPLIRKIREEEICPLFSEFINMLRSDGRIGVTSKKEACQNDFIGWMDCKKDDLLYLDYKKYFEELKQFSRMKNIELNLSQGKLQRLYLYKNEIIRPESKSEIPKFQCMRVIAGYVPDFV